MSGGSWSKRLHLGPIYCQAFPWGQRRGDLGTGRKQRAIFVFLESVIYQVFDPLFEWKLWEHEILVSRECCLRLPEKIFSAY
jgi:hypothetical protein